MERDVSSWRFGSGMFMRMSDSVEGVGVRYLLLPATVQVVDPDQVVHPGDDGGKHHVGVDLHGRVHVPPRAALVPDPGPGIPGKEFPLGGHERRGV